MADKQPQEKYEKKKVRSAAYPSLNLEKSLAAIRVVKDSLGSGPFDREVVAKAMGYKSLSGAASMAVAALVHYGLLARRGNVYEVSHLAESYLTYRDDSERRASMLEAARRPKLYADLLSKYGGKSLPSMLDNILVRDHSINERVASDVKNTFIASMAFVGLYENGVLKDPETISLGDPSPADEEKETDLAQEAPEPPTRKTQTAVTGGVIPITKGFAITYPEDVSLFELMTNTKFVGAATSLKEAIEELSKTRKAI